MLLVSFFALASFPAAWAIWPQPHRLETGNTTVWLSKQVELVFTRDKSGFARFSQLWDKAQNILPHLQDGNDSSGGELTASELEFLQSAFARTKKNIFDHVLIPHKFHPRGASFEPDVAVSGEAPVIQAVAIDISPSAALLSGDLPISADEAYSLHLSEDGEAIITATSVAGCLHALQTFTQLFYGHSESADNYYTSLAPVSVLDGPRFAHRGINLDISRNYIPPKDVLRVIDGMALTKLNRLHIHASDAQSWPLEVPALPDLALKGAYDKSRIWSADDLVEVQEHGKTNGVDVYIEIDIPGHTTSIGLSQPELITAAEKQPWEHYAAEPPSGQLKLNSSDVQNFLTTLFDDLLPRNAKYSNLFHFGGDELNKNAYELDETVNSSDKKVIQPLLQAFMDHVFQLAEKHSQTPVLWEEMLLEWDLNLPPSTIIQTWRSTKALSKVLSKGHQVLFGANTHFYLDCGFGTFLDAANPIEPISPIVQPPYADWCSPYKNWRQVYSYNPLDGVPEDQKGLIIGGEVHLWGELTDPVTLDSMLWPRAAAAAELMWQGPGTPVSEDTTRRLAEIRERLVAKGIGAAVVQMEWCLKHPKACTL